MEQQKKRIEALLEENRRKSDALASLQQLCEELTADYESRKGTGETDQLALGHLMDENTLLRQQLEQAHATQALLEERVSHFNEEWNTKTSHLRKNLENIRGERDKLLHQRDELLEGHRVLRREVEEYQLQMKTLKDEVERRVREEKREADRRREENYREKEEQLRLREMQLQTEVKEVETTLLRITSNTTVNKETIDQLTWKLNETEKVLRKKELLMAQLESEVEALRERVHTDREDFQRRLQEREEVSIEKDKSRVNQLASVQAKLMQVEGELALAEKRSKETAQHLQTQLETATEEHQRALVHAAGVERALHRQLRELQSALDTTTLEAQKVRHEHALLLQERERERQQEVATEERWKLERASIDEKDRLIRRYEAQVKGLLLKVKETEDQMEKIQCQTDQYRLLWEGAKQKRDPHSPVEKEEVKFIEGGDYSSPSTAGNNNDDTHQAKHHHPPPQETPSKGEHSQHIETIIYTPFSYAATKETPRGPLHPYSSSPTVRSNYKVHARSPLPPPSSPSPSSASPLLLRKNTPLSPPSINTNPYRPPHDPAVAETGENKENKEVYFDDDPLAAVSGSPLSPLPPAPGGPPPHRPEASPQGGNPEAATKAWIKEAVREALEQTTNTSHSSASSLMEKELTRRRLLASSKKYSLSGPSRRATVPDLRPPSYSPPVVPKGLGRPPTSGTSSNVSTDVEDNAHPPQHPPHPNYHNNNNNNNNNNSNNVSQVSTVASGSQYSASQRYPDHTSSQRLFPSNHSSWQHDERSRTHPQQSHSDVSVSSVASHLSAASSHVDAVQVLLERYQKAQRLSEEHLEKRMQRLTERQKELLQEGEEKEVHSDGVPSGTAPPRASAEGPLHPSAVENFEKRLTSYS